MRSLFGYFLLGTITTALPASIMAFSHPQTSKERPWRHEEKNEVLAESVIDEQKKEITEDVPNTNTPTPKPTKKPEPTNTSTPKPTPTPISSEEIMKLLEGFAGQYGVDPNVLRHIAICESGFNPNAANGPYIGLYQFGPITWATNRILIGEDPDINLRYSAEESIQTAAYMLATKGRQFWPNCQP